MQEVTFSPEAWKQLAEWTKRDHRKAASIWSLIKEAVRDPGEGRGNPERLKHDYTDCWSRRIDRENRLIYKPIGDGLYVASCEGHYM